MKGDILSLAEMPSVCADNTQLKCWLFLGLSFTPTVVQRGDQMINNTGLLNCSPERAPPFASRLIPTLHLYCISLSLLLTCSADFSVSVVRK